MKSLLHIRISKKGEKEFSIRPKTRTKNFKGDIKNVRRSLKKQNKYGHNKTI